MDLHIALQEALGSSYLVERELGGGGMSRVFLADDTALGRRVVIKVLPPEVAASSNHVRFKREVQVAAQLRHPHIVPLLTAETAGGLVFYTMPFVEGDSLRARLSKGPPIARDEAIQIIRDVAGALAYAHARGVIHRDIKPENILLDSGHAVVTDFGIARALSVMGTGKLTETGLGIGTPAYMSPEQMIGDPAIDARADIYSLGCVLYEMISGRSPVQAAAAIASAETHLRGFGDLLPVLAKSLALDASSRFENAERFLDALSRSGHVTRPRRRALSRHGIIAALLCFILYGLYYALGHGRSTTAEARLALEERNVVAQIGMGRESYFAARYADAISRLDPIVLNDRIATGHRKEAVRFLARSYLALKRPADAKAALRRLLDLEPPMVLLLPQYETRELLALYYDARREKAASQGVGNVQGREHYVAIYDFFSYKVNSTSSDTAKGISDLFVMAMLDHKVKLVDRTYRPVEDSGDTTYYAVEPVRRNGIRATDVILGTVNNSGRQILITAWAFDVATGRPTSVQQVSIDTVAFDPVTKALDRMAAGFARDLRSASQSSPKTAK